MKNINVAWGGGWNTWDWGSKWLSAYEMSRIVSTLTARFGTKIRTGRMWRTAGDGSVIEMPAQRLYNTADVGKLVHEIAHVHLSKPDTTHDNVGHFIVNAIDDARINKKILDIYAGAETYIEDAVREKVGTRWTHNTPSEQYAIACSLVGYWTQGEILSSMTHETAKNAFLSTYKAIENATAPSNSFERMIEIIDRDIMATYLSLVTPQEKDRANSSKESTEEEKGGCEIERKKHSYDKEETRDSEWGWIEREDVFDQAHLLHERALGYLPRYMRALSNLKDKMQPRWKGEKERGKIDPRKLHSIATGTSKRVFMQRSSKAIGTSERVVVLIDFSGSMKSSIENTPRGMKSSCYASALANGLSFAMACHKSGKQVCVLGFNKHMVTLTKWGERPNAHTMRERITASEILKGWGWNCDHVHLKRASEILREGALVVFSDGNPAPCGDYSRTHQHDKEEFSSDCTRDRVRSISQTLRDTATEIEASGKVKIYSVGLSGHDVKQFYRTGETTYDDTQVSQVLARLYSKLK